MARTLTTEQVEIYHRDGFLHLPEFFDPQELEPLHASLSADPTVGGRIHYVHDGNDETRGDDVNSYRLDYIGWYRDGDDWLGTCTRLEGIVECAATLIGEPVYHYHSKLVRKPNVGSGSLIWHQDFGGWYQDGCLMPDMLTFVGAVTDSDNHSGCLRFLKGSHKMGRVDRLTGENAYANIQPRRLAAMQAQFEEVGAEMRAGDGAVLSRQPGSLLWPEQCQLRSLADRALLQRDLQRPGVRRPGTSRGQADGDCRRQRTSRRRLPWRVRSNPDPGRGRSQRRGRIDLLS